MFSQRALVRPKSPRHCLIDNGNGFGFHIVEIVEEPAPEQADSEEMKVSGRNDGLVHQRRLVVLHVIAFQENRKGRVLIAAIVPRGSEPRSPKATSSTPGMVPQRCRISRKNGVCSAADG